jgi:hypothetical protein
MLIVEIYLYFFLQKANEHKSIMDGLVYEWSSEEENKRRRNK